MDCQKYLVTNKSNKYRYFNYHTCGPNSFQSQVVLFPYRKKTIWALDNTVVSAFSDVEITDLGNFPIVFPTHTPTTTPTQTKTPTMTPTQTKTSTPTPTQTKTPTVTPSPTKTVTPTHTKTPTPTHTPTPTKTVTPTVTKTQTPSHTPTNTPTNTVTPTITSTSTQTPSVTPTKTSTPSVTPSQTETPTNTPTNTPTPSETPTNTPTPSATNVIGDLYEVTVESGASLIGGGTNTGLGGDDTISGALSIGFPFKFWTDEYNDFYVNTNGVLMFNSPSNAWSQTTLPTASYQAAIFGFWHDMWVNTPPPPTMEITTQVIGTNPDRILVVRFLIFYLNSPTYYVQFEIRLHETSNVIELVYGDSNPLPNTGTIGIQKTSSGPSNQYSYNQGVPVSGTKITFTPN